MDRDWLLDVNAPWLKEFHDFRHGASNDPRRTQERLHSLMLRVRDLHPKVLAGNKRGQAVVDRTADRGHPTLLELVPRRTLNADGSTTPPEAEFFARSKKLSALLASRKGASVHQVAEAVDPKTTPWLISTIHGASPPSRWPTCFAPSHRKPDVILLDLQYRARARLGENWRRRTADAIARFRQGDTAMPVIAIADDPFVAEFARHKLEPKPKGAKRPRALPVSFVVQDAPALLGEDDGAPPSSLGACTGFSHFDVQIFGSDLAMFAAKALRIRGLTASIADGVVARSIGVCLTRLRAVANAPMSQSSALRALEDDDEPNLSRRLLEGFDVGGAISVLRAAAKQADQYEADVEQLAVEAGELAKGLSANADVTTGGVVRRRIEALPNRGTRTLVAAATVGAARLLEAWLETDPSLAPVANRLGEKFDIVPARDALSELRISASSTRPFGHVLFLSPTPRPFLAAITDDACPKRVEILSDAASARFIADYGEVLLRHWAESTQARRRIALAIEHIRDRLDKDLTDLPTLDFGDPAKNVSTDLDLTTRRLPPNTEVTLLTTTDGQCIRATQDTSFVTRRRADLERFEVLKARELKAGREVLVPSADFIEALGTASVFRAAAVPFLADYHDAVRKRAKRLNGATLKEKSRVLLRMIEDETDEPPKLASVERWLDVDRQNEIPPELRIPQAPRSYRHFLAFSTCLGIEEKMVDLYWTLAITSTRGRRIRSGFQLRRLYMSALVDPDATLRTKSVGQELIEYVRDLASEHIFEIGRVETKIAGNA